MKPKTIGKLLDISIHALVKRATHGVVITRQKMLFQSTPS